MCDAFSQHFLSKFVIGTRLCVGNGNAKKEKIYRKTLSLSLL